MRTHSIFAALLLFPVLALAGDAKSQKREVTVTHYGYPGDPHANRHTRLGLGDHNNILNKDSVAVSPDLDRVFPFGSEVSLDGKFIGYRHDTIRASLQNAVAIYDPKGAFGNDFKAFVDVPIKNH